MKKFFSKYSYDCVIMFVDQIAIAMFGLGLALACGKAENYTLVALTSVGAILFYLFILYTKVWQIGAKDRISVDCGHEKRDLLMGLKMSLVSNSLNFLLAIITMVSFILSGKAGTGGVIALLVQGMYTGVLTVEVFGRALNLYAISYYVIIIPALLTCLVGYIMGYYHIGLAKVFAPPAPKVSKAEKKKK